jgi:hypothetical protein
VAGIIPVILGSTAQSVLVFQLLNLDFNVQWSCIMNYFCNLISSLNRYIFSTEVAKLNILLQNDLVILNPTMLCTSLIVHIYL